MSLDGAYILMNSETIVTVNIVHYDEVLFTIVFFHYFNSQYVIVVFVGPHRFNVRV